MDFGPLKSHIMAMFAINQSQGKQGQSDFFMVLYSLILMTLVERAFKVLPGLIERAWASATKAGSQALSQTLMTPILDTQPVNSITLRRTYDANAKSTDTDASVEKVDGVLEYICSLDAAKHIKLDRRYILNTKEEIQITPHLSAKVLASSLNEKGELTDLQIVLQSAKLGINEMRAWIDTIYREYCFEKDNKLGQSKFYFNEIPVEPIQEIAPLGHGEKPQKDAKKQYRWDSAPKTLTFTMNEFATSKSFANVFGEHVAELKERLNLFMNHPEWYQARGIPYSLGILLHGIPGAGKTSTIKAIARDTKRHIFNLSLRPYTTQKQLLHLFFNENVAVVGDDGVRQVYRIPVSQRIYVIEDIDCLTDVVYQRTEETRLEPNGDAITLSFLLNLLDGVLETPGRILIITTNHPEKLDRALVRPGRIDVNIGFKEASRQLIAEMLNNFYRLSKKAEDIPACLEGALTPAEVLECFCGHFKDADAALGDLIRKAEPKCGTTLEDLFTEAPAEISPMANSIYISPSNVSLSISEDTEKRSPTKIHSDNDLEFSGGIDLKPIEKYQKTQSVDEVEFEYLGPAVLHPLTKKLYGSDPSHPKMFGTDAIYSDTSLVNSSDASGLDEQYAIHPELDAMYNDYKKHEKKRFEENIQLRQNYVNN
jgi:hypothetical protein